MDQRHKFILGFEEAIGSLTHTVCRDKDSFGATILALEIQNKGNAYFADIHDYINDKIYDDYGATHPQTFSFKIESDD
ncbi:MAG: hypothetical protein MJ223_02895 [Mycoplasmoidaceae bacterium]|nr:hypothetical protein [Mycoplasmoidaceae bacterium]